MTGPWCDFLGAIAAAAGGQRTLGPEHPAVRDQVHRAHRAATALASHPEPREAVIADGLVLVGQNLIALPAPVLRQIDALCHAAQRSAIRVAREPTLEDTAALVARLAGLSDAATPAFELRRVAMRQPQRSAASASERAPLNDQGMADLSRILSAVHADAAGIEHVIALLADRTIRVLRAGSAALLPLATLKRHDEYTLVHSINVGLLASALAQAVGVDGDRLRELTIGALLHDVGKTAIPLHFLNKPGALTPNERAIMQQHPAAGAALLAARSDVPDLAPIVAYEHHANLDGSGYPALPRAWRISLGSQVVHVADVFDALRTHRPYRPAMPPEQCLELMARGAGTHFDAQLYDVFARYVAERAAPSTPGAPEAPPETNSRAA